MNVIWLEPWVAIADLDWETEKTRDYCIAWEEQLKREVGPHHALHRRAPRSRRSPAAVGPGPPKVGRSSDLERVPTVKVWNGRDLIPSNRALLWDSRALAARSVTSRKANLPARPLGAFRALQSG
jgi:hypothetical protein